MLGLCVPSQKMGLIPCTQGQNNDCPSSPTRKGPPHPHSPKAGRPFANLAGGLKGGVRPGSLRGPVCVKASQQVGGVGRRPPSGRGHLVGIPSPGSLLAAGGAAACRALPFPPPAHKSRGTRRRRVECPIRPPCKALLGPDSTLLGSGGPLSLPQVSREPRKGHGLGAGQLRRVHQKGEREGGWLTG